MTTQKHVTLTADYRMTSDGERNFTLERRHIVDPTKAPGFERKNAESIAETGAGLSTETREEWREADVGNYAFNQAGLTALLSSVALRTAWAKDHAGLMIGDFAVDIAEEYGKLREAVSGLFTEVT